MPSLICRFSCGVELADLLVNSGLLSRSWDAISDTQHPFLEDPTPASVKFKVHHSPNVIIIAFASSPQGTVHHFQTHGGDLVSSEELKGSFDLFDFVATKLTPSFAIHRAAVAIFHSLLNELTDLRNQLHSISTPLVVTGHCLGGSVASLFTLWLLDGMPPTASKHALCITFGAPLLGDRCFQQAISERPMWNSRFLQVVSKKDVVPYLSINGGSISHTRAYMPFGTFIFCSESGCACFEEPESVLEILMAMGSNFAGNPYEQNSFQIVDYRQVFVVLMHDSIYRRALLVDNSFTNLQAGIMMQLIAIEGETQGSGGGDMNSFTTTIAERARTLQTSKRNVFDPNKTLAERKIDMTYLEWYKKMSYDEGGYYDSYKNKQSGSREQIKTRLEVVKRHRILTQYWKRMVNEVERMPQKEGSSFRTRWLYGGTNYRRLVEPLDIADYYMKGHRDYVTRGRSQHYVLLEKWFNDGKPVDDARERNNACSLTEDSCFWAHVEEAIISCKVLKDGGSSSEHKRLSRDKLVEFEHYVMDLIQKFAVSPEIFLPGSSFMKWWEDYCVIVGNLDHSPLADFMKSEYKNYA